MNVIFLELTILLLLILGNGLLAMAEIAIISARKVRLQRSAEQGDDSARRALELADEPADFLSAVQVGITLVGVLAGAFGGATLAETLAGWLATFPRLAPYSEAIAVGVVVVAITYTTLILGELAPKRLALNNPERIASLVARPMQTLARLTSPVVGFLSGSTNLVLKVFGLRPADNPLITEEEIKVLIQQGTQAGIFEEAEQELVSAVFRLSGRRVDALMTPRTEVVWLDLDDPEEQIRAKLLENNFSRYPVARGDLDHVLGVLQARDLLASSLEGQGLALEAAMSAPLFVPDSMPAMQVLDLFKTKQSHIALVIDEYGGFQGLVTAFDLLEAIVGALPEPGVLEEAEVLARPDGSWLVDGMMDIDDFTEQFDIALLPGEERGYYQTLGGFMMTYLGHIPRTGEGFEWGGWRFEVVDMDGRRVDKVMLVPLKSGV